MGGRKIIEAKEIWKDIKEYEGKYQISNKGNVKSLSYNNTGKEKILKPKINKQGHLEVTLNKNDKHYYKMINRLVIQEFTHNKLTKNDIVMYRDKNKTNCALDNLYIISRGKRQELTYDIDHRYRHKYNYYGKILPIKEIAKTNNIKPEQIRNRLNYLYWNIYEAAEIPLAKYQKKN